MYGYGEVRAARAAVFSLYIIPIRYQTYCQSDCKQQWAWQSSLALHRIYLYWATTIEHTHPVKLYDALFWYHLAIPVFQI